VSTQLQLTNISYHVQRVVLVVTFYIGHYEYFATRLKSQPCEATDCSCVVFLFSFTKSVDDLLKTEICLAGLYTAKIHVVFEGYNI
jgi:hypothetical protein